jgi:hypothetical protein
VSNKPADRFRELLRKLVRVPKDEIDEQEEEYQEQRKRHHDERALPGEMLPREKAGD